MKDRALLEELHARLRASHDPIDVEVDRIGAFAANPDWEIHRCGSVGVLAYFGDYLVVSLPEPRDIVANREVYRLIAKRLSERGLIRHMVHPRNFPSVKSTRRLGAVPTGYDADGYMHYELTPTTFKPYERFKPRGPADGQEVSAAEAA